MKFIEWFVEFFSWMKIVLSPLFIGAIVGGIYYGYHQNRNGIIIGSCIAGVGLIIGIIWATRVSKKEGATNFLARNDSSPELDKPDEK